MSPHPRISVVTPSLNQGEFIRDAIDSVLAQNYPNFEHIIVDGGSTDGTLDILREYPHLTWSSEPDRGQSDALNKGFGRARGEIIAWLNADDWYAPGAFEGVAAALEHHPVVIGAAQETDEHKNPRQIVSNIPRTFFDLLKYWVPYAWLAQPSVFFKRSLLESVRYPDGRYLDESLHFAMDYDLWMRMGLRVDFNHRLDRVLSHYRIYDRNKTGQHPLLALRECKRVFRRYERAHGSTERLLSFVIPIEAPAALAETLQALIAQTLRNFEIVIVDYSKNSEHQRFFRETVHTLEESSEHLSIRYLRSPQKSFSGAFNHALMLAASDLIALVMPGDIPSPSFAQDAANEFTPDITALALPLPKGMSPSSLRDPVTSNLSAHALFEGPPMSARFVARRIALFDAGGMMETRIPSFALTDLALKLIARGWFVSVENPLTLATPSLNPAERALFENARPFINAHLLQELVRLQECDPFLPIRAAHGLALTPVESMVSVAQTLLSRMPANWRLFEFPEDASSLRSLAERFPGFLPVWGELAARYEEIKDVTHAEEARIRGAQEAQTLGVRFHSP